MMFTPAGNCCQSCVLPGCSRSVGTLRLTSTFSGVPSTTLTLNSSDCSFYGCGLRPSGPGRSLRVATCATTNSDGSASQPRVYRFAPNGELTILTPRMACEIGGGFYSYFPCSGTCPDDLTDPLPFGASQTQVGSISIPPYSFQIRTFSRRGTGSALACNPYHYRISIGWDDGSTETIDLSE